jgi:hypothetical protein
MFILRCSPCAQLIFRRAQSSGVCLLLAIKHALLPPLCAALAQVLLSRSGKYSDSRVQLRAVNALRWSWPVGGAAEGETAEVIVCGQVPLVQRWINSCLWSVCFLCIRNLQVVELERENIPYFAGSAQRCKTALTRTVNKTVFTKSHTKNHNEKSLVRFSIRKLYQ